MLATTLTTSRDANLVLLPPYWNVVMLVPLRMISRFFAIYKGRVWRLQNRTSTRNSPCEIRRWPRATGWGRNGATGHDW